MRPMHSYFIPHRLKTGDITNLSDSDSERIIAEKQHKVEDILRVSTHEASFNAVITNIAPASIEVEVLEEVPHEESKEEGITLIQSVSGDRKFNYLLEKAVEIGVRRVIPIVSEYSTLNIKKAARSMGKYQKIIADATEQSRNPYPTELTPPIQLKKLDEEKLPKGERLCLATENVNAASLKNVVKKEKNYIIAIGPETGWSSQDLNLFKSLGFRFIKLEGNILRTETAGLVISSVIQYIKGKI